MTAPQTTTSQAQGNHATRSDGAQTRQRLLEAAYEVFAEAGFHNATTAAICDKAEANAAAISYHFGGKKGLYVAVWEDALDTTGTRYPIESQLTGDENPRELFEICVRTLVQIVSHNSIGGLFHRIELHEMVRPTGLVDLVFQKAIEPRKARMQQAIGGLLAPHDSLENIQRCEYSVISQCKSVQFAINRAKPMFGKTKLTQRDLDALAEHIVAFSLAGIQATKTPTPGSQAPGPRN